MKTIHTLKFYLIFFASSNFANQIDYQTLDKNLEKLITFKTISSDKQKNKAAINWIKQELKSLPVHIHEYQSNGFASLVVTTQSNKSPKLWLIAHVDVVGGDDYMFQLKKQNDAFNGRGVLDMKFAIACYIQLFKKYAKEIYQINVCITRTHAASDAKYFSKKNIPILLITPTGANAHSPNESLDINDFHRYYHLISIWAKEISKVKEN